MDRRTVLSEDRIYRYVLWREWDFLNPSYVNFIGLNPSTADETKDDATIRRCIHYAKDWGYGALCMTNLFAYRATDPNAMKDYFAPGGPDNERWLSECAQGASKVIAAWGTHGGYRAQDVRIASLLARTGIPVFCLGLTKEGFPKHPVRLRADLVPILYDQPSIKW